MNLISQMKENGTNIIVYYQEDFEYMLSEYNLLEWYSGETSKVVKKQIPENLNKDK